MKKLLYITALAACFTACKEEENSLNKGVLTVETLSVTNLTDTSAVCWGRITNEGGNGVKEYGIEVYDNNLAKMVLLPATLEQADSFAVQVSGFHGGSSQPYKAYAIDNNGGVQKGKQVMFSTLTRPYMYFYGATVATATTLAVRFERQEDWQAWGLHYSSADTATSSDPQVASSSQDTITLTGLQPNTQYFMLPYVVGKNQLTSYHYQALVASTKCAAPQLHMVGASDITISSATASFEVGYTGGGNLTICEVKYSTDGGAWSTAAATYAEGQIGVALTGLKPAKRYKVFAIAGNVDVVSVSDTLEFRTLGGIPVLATPTVAAIKTYKVSFGNGQVTNDSSLSVTEYGYCWSTTSGQAVASGSGYKAITTGSPTSFTDTTYALLANTTYYLRAYAKNQVGVGYSQEVELSTPAVAYGEVADRIISEKKYKTVLIGSQTWMAEDLEYNGKTRFTTTDIHSHMSTICPTGWRLPVQNELSALVAEVKNTSETLRANDGSSYTTGTNSTGLGLTVVTANAGGSRSRLASSTYYPNLGSDILYQTLLIIDNYIMITPGNNSDQMLIRCIKE